MNNLMKKALSHGLALVIIIGVVAVVGVFMMSGTNSSPTGLAIGNASSSPCVDTDVPANANGNGIIVGLKGNVNFNGKIYEDFCVAGPNSNKKVASSKYIYEYYCYNTSANSNQGETTEPSKYGVKVGRKLEKCPSTGTCSGGQCYGCTPGEVDNFKVDNFKCQEESYYGNVIGQKPVLLSKGLFQTKETINLQCVTTWEPDKGCGLAYGVAYLDAGYTKVKDYSWEVEPVSWPYNYVVTNYRLSDVCQDKKGCIKHTLVDSYCDGNWQVNISKSTLTEKTNMLKSDCSKSGMKCEVNDKGAACVYN